MSYTAKILADSVSPGGVRLTTMEVTFPRIVLAEFSSHRVFSCSSADSCMIPIEKSIQRVLDDPFLPVWWGKNQSGMQAVEELSDERRPREWRPGELGTKGGAYMSDREQARRQWLCSRDQAVASVRALQVIGLHEQIVSRLLDPFLWCAAIVTATEWDSFFASHCCKGLPSEGMRIIAEMTRELYHVCSPREVHYDEWHLPFVDDSENIIDPLYAAKVSAGRCARVSYFTHDGRRDPVEDVALADRLRAAGHMSPFEHAARPAERGECDDISGFFGNFRGWVQYRKLIPNEAVYRSTEE